MYRASSGYDSLDIFNVSSLHLRLHLFTMLTPIKRFKNLNVSVATYAVGVVLTDYMGLLV